MTRDSLATVARLRRLAQDDARQALSLALAHQARMAARADSAARDIVNEAEAAASIHVDDAVVEAFAAWLPVARAHAADTRAECERAEAEVARLRAVLTASRAAMEAVETLMAQRDAVLAQARTRRAEIDLDDATRPPPDPHA